MKRFFLLSLILIATTSLVGCQAWHGLGQDIENLGQKIQKED